MSSHEDEQPWARPSAGSPDQAQPGNAQTGSGWGAPFPPPASGNAAGYEAESSRQPEAEASGTPSMGWLPPTEPHRTAAYGSWTPPSSSTSSSSGGKAGGFFKWLAVVAVSALVGASTAAAVVDNGDANSDGGVTSTTSPSASQQVISSPATPSSIRSVLDKVQPAVVTVQAESVGSSGSGTGMIFTADGYVLTNAHVVRGSSAIRVTMNGKKEPVSARLLGMDASIDSAVIKIDSSEPLPTVELGDSSQLQVGDEVVAIGNALALTGGPSVTTGIVSAKDREISDGTQALENLIQTDAAINPGNSGGPLVNMAGQVIGMNTAVIRGQEGEFQNIGFAMAVNTIKPALEDLKAGKVQQQALLGVSAVTLDDDIRDRYNLTPETGAVIDSVTPNGPADKAGLARFDVITAIDGETIESSDELTSEVRSHRPNDRVTITYFRGDDERRVDVTLGARPTSG